MTPAPAGNNPICPTLFIGLGGTGKEVLLRMRRRFYERFRTTGLPCTRYLWIDTDIRDLGARGESLDEAFAAVSFTDTERVALLNGTVGESVGDIFVNRERWSYIHDWLYEEVERYGTGIKDGAGGVRAVGRLTFFWNYQDLKTAIGRELTRLTQIEVRNQTRDFYRQHGLGEAVLDNNAQALVIIVSSVAGGTGAGTYLDTAFLLKQLAHENVAQISQIFSYLLLPNVYHANSNAGQLAKRSFANAYAALEELDHYLLRMPGKGGKDGDHLHIDYIVAWEDQKKLRVMGPPMDATYLLEMCNEGGLSLSFENRRELFGMLAESLFLDLLPGAFATSKRSDYSNITQQLSGSAGANSESGGVVLPQSFSRRYAACGLSKIEIPVDALRASCAAQLGCDIARKHILRENDDPTVKQEVRTDLATYKLDRDGIPDSYGVSWKDTIHNEVLKDFRTTPIRDEGTVNDLEQKLFDLDKKLVYSEGADKTRLGDVIRYLRDKTGSVTEDGKKQLSALVVERCLENEGRGLPATLRTGGYLDQVIAAIRDLSAPPDTGVKAYFDQEAEAAAADAAAWEGKRTLLVQELRTALGSMTVAVLGLKSWTIGKLVERLQDAHEQALRSRAYVCLYQESKKCAEGLVKTLSEQRARLEKLQQFLQQFANTQETRAIGFRTLQSEMQVLMYRLYDEKNWDQFYRLDKDEGGELKEVNLQIEYRSLLTSCFGAESNLLNLISSLERDGEDLLEKHIVDFCEDRFWRDFYTNRRAVDVLDHPLMKARRSEYLQKLVDAARPMLRQAGRMGAAFVDAPKFAYLGIADPNANPYRQVVNEVNQLIQNIHGYNYQLQAHATGNPSEIYLYMSNYAYALPSLPLVSGEAHDAYWDFYTKLNENSQGAAASQVPLHLSKRWEGKFDDLVVYTDETAKVLREIYYILLFGQILKVLTLKDQKGLHIYQYKLGAPFSKMAPLGPRRQVVATLQRDQDLRAMLMSAIKTRENSLNTEQVVSYYWAIQASLNSPDLIANTPEATLLTQKLDKEKGGEAYERALAAVADPSILKLDAIPEPERFDWIKSLNAARLEWFAGSYPALKDIDAWEKQGARAAF